MQVACMYALPPFLHAFIVIDILQVISITDLDRRDSMQATNQIRQIAKLDTVEPEVMEEAISIVGGRLAFLNKVRLFDWLSRYFLTSWNRFRSRKTHFGLRSTYWTWRRDGC